VETPFQFHGPSAADFKNMPNQPVSGPFPGPDPPRRFLPKPSFRFSPGDELAGLRGGKFHKEHAMSLFTIVIAIIVVGVLLWLANAYIPMDATVKRILNIVVIIALVLWLLKAFGLFEQLAAVRV
jgi:hypothetical protein